MKDSNKSTPEFIELKSVKKLKLKSAEVSYLNLSTKTAFNVLFITIKVPTGYTIGHLWRKQNYTVLQKNPHLVVWGPVASLAQMRQIAVFLTNCDRYFKMLEVRKWSRIGAWKRAEWKRDKQLAAYIMASQ